MNSACTVRARRWATSPAGPADGKAAGQRTVPPARADFAAFTRSCILGRTKAPPLGLEPYMPLFRRVLSAQARPESAWGPNQDEEEEQLAPFPLQSLSPTRLPERSADRVFPVQVTPVNVDGPSQERELFVVEVCRHAKEAHVASVVVECGCGLHQFPLGRRPPC